MASIVYTDGIKEQRHQQNANGVGGTRGGWSSSIHKDKNVRINN